VKLMSLGTLFVLIVFTASLVADPLKFTTVWWAGVVCAAVVGASLSSSYHAMCGKSLSQKG
jgi:hypothetical protein